MFPAGATELIDLVSSRAQSYGDRTIRLCMEILEDVDRGRYAFTRTGEPLRVSEACGWITAEYGALIVALLDKRLLAVGWNDERPVPEAEQERLGNFVLPAILTDRGREALDTVIVV